MGIGNITELTEADSTGVAAMLIGFCQELGIRNVLTTEVIDWARGAVREAILAAQLMYFAQQEGTPPKHVDGRLLTILTDQPLLFLGAGLPGAKPKEGYDFAVIDIEVDAKGNGSGTLAPAAKLRMNQAAFVVDDYGAELVRLTAVKKTK